MKLYLYPTLSLIQSWKVAPTTMFLPVIQSRAQTRLDRYVMMTVDRRVTCLLGWVTSEESFWVGYALNVQYCIDFVCHEEYLRSGSVPHFSRALIFKYRTDAWIHCPNSRVSGSFKWVFNSWVAFGAFGRSTRSLWYLACFWNKIILKSSNLKGVNVPKI